MEITEEYIAYHEFPKHNGPVFPVGETFKSDGKVIYFWDYFMLCMVHSQKAHDCLAYNGDQMGMRRGVLRDQINKILTDHSDMDAFEDRLDAIWDDQLLMKYNANDDPKYPWLWNDDWYKASIEDMEYCLDLLKKVTEQSKMNKKEASEE